MWDPLLNEFPDSVHGFRCMLAIKYLQAVEETYEPNTLGYDLIRDLFGVIRARDYVQATRRYNHFHTRLEGSSKAELRQPLHEPCCCPHCPRHQKQNMGQQAHLSEAQDVQNVSKPRCP
ncbi:movement protein [Tomato leaf curl Mahe virus]|uniref:Protein V2 n=1 Tax=Tomato leaf curl Mahe virus TaxID=2303151 RepID=A0A346FY84_9GEMI|nr:movement protein [Tomato leaf curl Mahe virus]AXN77426.1 movement protein [Tomato leaf curl Mahe virus]AXN77437.1 movement protein [Tomato leaf curl Mahe virus]AXN77438.1 movement protein [Tomato leaf curl Mahe virus]AXN77444.1 movement protein [Tomato leaf curl Mahe virus]AXN77450.1 movement protein [Tomato leaf curl Mahe virus]